MKIPSPFKGSGLDRELVCEFFAVFCRFEFALKEAGCVRIQGGVVQPAWWQFAEDAAGWIQVESESVLATAIQVLCEEPPEVQTGAQTWEPRGLHGESELEKAVDAARRVRNNLFHGGKHTRHSPPERDKRLIQASLQLLYGCLKQDRDLYEVYVQNQF